MMKIIEVEILVEVVDVEVVAIVVVTNPDIQVYHSSSRFYCNIYEKMLSWIGNIIYLSKYVFI